MLACAKCVSQPDQLASTPFRRCWTRLTACWTWALSPRSARLWARSAPTARRCSGPPPGPRRSRCLEANIINDQMVILDLHVRHFCAPVPRGSAALLAEQAGGSCAWCLALAVCCGCASRLRGRSGTPPPPASQTAGMPTSPSLPLIRLSSNRRPCVPLPPLLPPQALAREFLHNAYQVLIGSPDLKANHRITQIFDFPAEHEKYHKLVRILEKVRPQRFFPQRFFHCRAGLCKRGGWWGACYQCCAGPCKSVGWCGACRNPPQPPASWPSSGLQPRCISPRCQPCARPAGDGRPPHPDLL